MGRRFTWVIVAGVGALLLFAGLDALRSSSAGRGSATPTASTTTAAATSSASSLLPCKVEDLRILIEVRRGTPTVVARNSGDRCYRVLRGWHLRVEDRAGEALAEWDQPQLLVDGIFPADSESAFRFSQVPIRCTSPGPYLASVAVGPYLARRGHLSADQVVCVKSRTAQTRREIERNGNRWAVAFGTGSRSCSHMIQPLCERIACVRAGGFKIRNCKPPTRAFRQSFLGATVEDIVIKGDQAAARFSNGEVVALCFCGPGAWWVEKLGDNAGRGFFE